MDFSSYIVVLFLILLSAVCSGLNISLMSLSTAELRRKSKLGDKRARRVLPLRERAHLSLAAILLANVAFASGAAIVLGDNFNGFVAVAISTLLLVVFAELLPQALFTRKALAFCTWLTPFIKASILITYPLAKPLQLALDALFRDLGDDSRHLHTRHELGLMIAEHLGHNSSELDEDEVEIIRGALQLSEKKVSDIMTDIRHVFWLTPDAVINSEQIQQIKKAGWSRIPIFNRKKSKCYGILLVKDLVDINFKESSYKVSNLPLHPPRIVGSRTALDTMFRHFIAAKTHLIPVEKNDRIIGIITIEDLLEEIIGHEIFDESDRSTKRS